MSLLQTMDATVDMSMGYSVGERPIPPQDVERRLVPLEITTIDPTRRTLTTTSGDLGDLLVTDWVCTASEGTVCADRLADQAESLLVLAPLAGRQHLRTGDETFVLQPGNILLLNNRTAAAFTIPDHLTKRTIKVPAVALSGFGLTHRLPDHLLLETASSPLTLVFYDFLMSVNRRLPGMSGGEIESTRSALLALLAGLISGTRTDTASNDLLSVLRRQMEQWIAEHLDKGPIRLADMARAHNVAPRTVHRAFSSTGDTLGEVVRARRLAAARDDLVRSASTISAIAHRWGYCDASHFGREFRRGFGSAPGAYREAFGTPLAQAAGRSRRTHSARRARTS
ncbi:helix-turn-helix transcriptional regulator [Microbacterium karelineae]|uniref:helix-turn-helix transcriptional regulator n=1 Tax=Microbacterium karelineae TaxID=2654283 RepID=UPI0018D37CA2|nr:AraC family transcriptional regulator [Microbacterium karelineae]